MIKSATRIAMLWLVAALPVLVWFGKVPPDKFSDALMLVLGGFFAIKGVQGSDQQK
jgi:hypothetical protein